MRLAFFALATASLAGCSLDWASLEPAVSTASSTHGSSSTSISVSTAQSSGTGAGGAGGTGGEGGSGGSGGATQPVTLVYPATSADCIFWEGTGGAQGDEHDPDACEQAVGVGEFGVDYFEGTSGLESHGYLRFELDEQLSGRTVTDVELRVLSAEDGPNAGDVWAVTSFNSSELFLGPPSRVGRKPLAPSHGPHPPQSLVTWTLPTSIASPESVVALEIAPLATTSMGIDYYNHNSLAPPVLVVTAE